MTWSGTRLTIAGVLELAENPKTILHVLHADSCGVAYVALAEHPDKNLVTSQCYNISSQSYEILDEIAKALVTEYGIQGGVKYVSGKYGPNESPATTPSRMLLGFSRWTGSDKLRKDVGWWGDKRILFSERLHQYRLAYEVAAGKGTKRWT